MKSQIKFIFASILFLIVSSCQSLSTTTSDPAGESSIAPKKARYERPKEILRRESLLSIPYRTIDTSKNITIFGFGSCNDQNLPQPLWKLIQARSPQLFLMMGDNVYGSKTENQSIADQYIKLNENKDYLDLREAVPFMATWDDHDYGQSDGGEDNPRKTEARKIFGQYWTYSKNIIPKNQGAIYHSRIVGEGKKRVQFILLDTRYDRSPLIKAPIEVPLLTSGDSTAANTVAKTKMYIPNEDPKARILSVDQWKWLEGELKKPAELRIIVSSIQFIADDPGFEKWGNFPLEKKRFLDLLNKNNIRNTVVLSGDRHLASVAKIQLNKKTELYDITSSALNKPSKAKEPELDPTYLAPSYLGINFGLASIDWGKRQLEIQIIGEDDKAHLNQTIKF
ncbi:MAG: alkaline phosphatase family protein [Moraxellaceae bacterium]|nr:alkaline phosphatase family protein [Pseudobdellovibrionaceae bacterium]